MILDRSPQEEPLIPAEKTKIRLEMSRKKQCSDESRKGGYDHDYASDSELIEEDQTERIAAQKRNEAKKTFEESVERKPPDFNLVAALNSSADAGKTDRKEEAKVEGTMMVDRKEKMLDKSRGFSSSRTAERKYVILQNISKIHTCENREIIDDIRKDSAKEYQLKQAQASNLNQSFPCNEDPTVNLSEGDAKKPTINISTPNSSKGQRHDQIADDLVKQRGRSAKCTVIWGDFLGKSGILGNTVKDSDSDPTKDSEENIVLPSNGTSKNRNCKNTSFMIEKARLGITPWFLPRQAEHTLPKEMKNSSERSTLGSTTTRLSLRQVVGCSNKEDYNHEVQLN